MKPTLIRGGRICDGTGSPPFTADILIRGDRIAEIGKTLSPEDCSVVDAEGLTVSPGFIDTHAHSDLSILAAPEALGKISQGITSEISGNCGLSAFPVLTEEVRSHLKTIYRTYGIEITWNDFQTFAQAIEQRSPAVNVGFLCGHNTLRANILGYDNEPGNPDDWKKIRDLLRNMLEQGASGLSTGLLYIPGKFSGRKELLTTAEALRDFNMPYATHLRSEGDELLESIDEALAIAEAGAGHLHISHLKTALPRNWHKLDAVFEKIESARKRGIKVTGDRYPYTYGQTSLSVILPSPYDKMTDAAIKETLNAEPEKRRELIRDLEKHHPAWDNIILCSSSVSGVECVFGKTIAEAAGQLRMSPAEFCAGLMYHDAPGTMAAFGGLSEENLKRIIDKPYICCGTDETARPSDYRIGRSHPRGFGSFPRFLNLELEKRPLEEIIHRLTAFPAELFGLKDRGTIEKDRIADLVLFDEEKLADKANFSEPHCLSEGIHQVYVNGVLSYAGQRVVARAGKVLKRVNYKMKRTC